MSSKSIFQETYCEMNCESICLTNGVFLLMGEIDVDLSKQVIFWILANNFEKKHQNLKMIINSEGGDLQTAFAVVDVMSGSSIPIQTIGVGTVASSGLVIFMAGQKGHRVLTPNTQILSHQYFWESSGKNHELVSISKEYSLMTKRMIAHYKKYTGLTDQIIKEKLLPPSDVWLSANEALKLKICDKVQDKVKI